MPQIVKQDKIFKWQIISSFNCINIFSLIWTPPLTQAILPSLHFTSCFLLGKNIPICNCVLIAVLTLGPVENCQHIKFSTSKTEYNLFPPNWLLSHVPCRVCSLSVHLFKCKTLKVLRISSSVWPLPSLGHPESLLPPAKLLCILSLILGSFTALV